MKLLNSLPCLPAIRGSCSFWSAHLLLSPDRLVSVPITWRTFFYRPQLTTLPSTFTLLSCKPLSRWHSLPCCYTVLRKSLLSFSDAACSLLVLFPSHRLLLKRSKRHRRVGIWHQTYTEGWDGRGFGVGYHLHPCSDVGFHILQWWRMWTVGVRRWHAPKCQLSGNPCGGWADRGDGEPSSWWIQAARCQTQGDLSALSTSSHAPLLPRHLFRVWSCPGVNLVQYFSNCLCARLNLVF